MRQKDSLQKSSDQERPEFLGVYFRCCNVYGRIYLKEDRVYAGKCPGCGRRARVDADKERAGRSFFQAFPIR